MSARKFELTPTTEPALLHRDLNERPHIVESASGMHLFLSSGKIVIDSCGGAAVAVLGHGNQEVLEAAVEQMRKVSYVHTGAYTTAAAENLAQILIQGNPHGLEKAFFVQSGSEAMDSAMKLACQCFFEQGKLERVNFVTRRQAYHGSTIGAMSVSSNLPRKIPYGPLMLSNVTYSSPAYSYHYQKPSETESEYTKRLVAELDEEFQKIGPETIIAFIAETVVGATSGCVTAPRGYFSGIRKLCNKYGILLILDEVMCGTGRTGTFFAFEQEGPDVTPDIMTLGKCLGGGYVPISGILVHKSVVDVIRRGSGCFNHGHTFQAHPIACAVALSVQKIIRRDDLINKCRDLGVVLGDLLQAAFGNRRYVGDIRGRGLFWALEFVQDKRTRESFSPSIAFSTQLYKRAFNLGLAVYPCVGTLDGVRGDHIIIAPPYVLTEMDLKNIVGILKVAYDDLESTLINFNGSKNIAP